MRYKMKKSKKNLGFTLIELSISLAIVALLLSTVFVVKKMRSNALLYSIMDDMNAQIYAFNNFKTVYKDAPGDMFNASSKFSLSGLTVQNGNSNGIIDNNSLEQVAAFQHLALAGLMPGTYLGTWSLSPTYLTYMPSKSKNGNDGYFYGSSSSTPGANFQVFNNNANSSNKNMIVYGAINDDNSNNIIDNWPNEATHAVLTPLDAAKLDNKYDDGLPTTGNVIAANGSDTSGGCVNTATTPNSFISSTTMGCYFAVIIYQ
jgi:prepilin-type N-terminal cleavage/methylation domain-containing protein